MIRAVIVEAALRAARAEQATRLRLFATVPSRDEPPPFSPDGLRLTWLNGELLDMIGGRGVSVEHVLHELWDTPRSRRGQRRRAARLRRAVSRLNKRLKATGYTVVRQGGELRLVYGDRTAVERCAAEIHWLLASGPRPTGDVRILLGSWFSAATIQRARTRLKVLAFRSGSRWFVMLSTRDWQDSRG